MDNIFLYVVINSLVFIFVYVFMLTLCAIAVPFLKKKGVAFSHGLPTAGEIIILFASRMLYITAAVVCGAVFAGGIPYYIYLTGFALFFICLLIYSPDRMKNHAVSKLYFWTVPLSKLFNTESRIFSALSVTLHLFFVQLIPYIITVMIVKIY